MESKKKKEKKVKKDEAGIAKVDRQGYKVEPRKDQWIFPRNFMLIRINLP